jgi:nitrogen-specific signal transduction histidine kinase
MFEFWCEYDINPLIIFNEKGYIEYCNQEAEIFLSYVNKKEVYEFVIKNAPSKPGVKTEFKQVKFKDFEFNGYSIGYKDDSSIGIRFFINTNTHSIELTELEEIDLSMLLNFAIEYATLKNSISITTMFDPSIPTILVHKKALLDIIFDMLENRKEALISTKINVGEYIKINDRKYQIIELGIQTEPVKTIKSPYFEILNKEDGYIIKIPLIKEIDENNNT